MKNPFAGLIPNTIRNCSTVQLQQLLLPFPQFSLSSSTTNGVSFSANNNGGSYYHALDVRLEKRYSHGLNFGANYTWSKYLGNINSGGTSEGNDAGTYSDLYNRRLDYGPTANDISHHFNAHAVYELPFGPSRTYVNRGPLSKILGNWNVSGTWVMYTGQWFAAARTWDGTRSNASAAKTSGRKRAMRAYREKDKESSPLARAPPGESVA